MSQDQPVPLRFLIALFLTAMTTLMLELGLTRVFDTILTPNMAYMVIACTLLSFGLAGIYSTLRPLPAGADTGRYLAGVAVLLALATVALRPALNLLPFNYEFLLKQPFTQLMAFAGMYLTMVVPFFLSGLIFTVLFSRHAQAIRRLYCWDLSGAALGCVALIPLLPPIGPGGLLLLAAALNLLAAGLFAPTLRFRLPLVVAAMALAGAPVASAPKYLGFTDHLHKRGVKEARENGLVEFSRWDPVSKIDVIELHDDLAAQQRDSDAPRRKHIAYDGGTQSSHITGFDGDLARLRREIDSGSRSIFDHFWQRGVLASHFIKRDSGQRVFIIGAAGGQETKAALMYGAAHVDAIELVSTVVELGRSTYARFNGGLFNDPRVMLKTDEGRAFLRASDARYDIIQIHSNFTTSSIANGTGAMSPSYLQTADAYREYFQKLTADGILHINHHTYPRLVTTAALAWHQLGRSDFQRHVLIFELQGVPDELPTMLIKMTPWTAAEVEAANAFMTKPWTPQELADLGRIYGQFGRDRGREAVFRMVQNPLDPSSGFLEPALFTGEFTAALAERAAYRLRPTTDDRPFFGMIRTQLRHLEPDPSRYLNFSTAEMLNSQLHGGVVAMDIVHLQVTAVISLLFALVFIFVPLRFAPIGRDPWPQRAALVTYFASLGAGFIILELVFVQIFMKLIGVPLYTYATVIFTLLLSAGVGSLGSGGLGITPQRRWLWPFGGVLGYGLVLVGFHGAVFDLFLAAPAAARVLVAATLIFPLGFCLGMPFPLGILAVAGRATGNVAWAWALNGLFTVIGSLASVVLALWLGFQATVLIALAIYALAALAFARLRAA